jgi:aspartate aminotransferase-like enzyme
LVSYTDDPNIQIGSKFLASGMQTAAGVPLQVGEGPEFKTFRIGLFGLDKLNDVEGSLTRLKAVVDRVL